jgi:molecular chaperone GrpE
LSSEEQQRREGESAGEPSEEVPREEEPRGEETSRPESADGSIEGEASGPVEANGSEEAEVVPELAPDAFDEEPGAEPEDAAEIAREEILALAGELETARRERDEYLDDIRRIKAEMENSRKRLERDRARYVQMAAERLVRDLLPVLDNLERALDIEGDVREGVKATRDQMLAILEGAGLEPVLSDGESFDPAVHEAVMGQPSEEHDEDTVIQTLERGYLLNGRSIRPAKVIVAKQV